MTATSPSPTTYVVSSSDRRTDSPLTNVGVASGYGAAHTPTASPISSARENDSECDRARRSSCTTNNQNTSTTDTESTVFSRQENQQVSNRLNPPIQTSQRHVCQHSMQQYPSNIRYNTRQEKFK